MAHINIGPIYFMIIAKAEIAWMDFARTCSQNICKENSRASLMATLASLAWAFFNPSCASIRGVLVG